MTVDRYTHLWELVIKPYIILVLCPFNRVITVSSPARVHRLCKQFLHPDKGSRSGLQPMEWALTLARKWLVTLMMFMPLLYITGHVLQGQPLL